MYNEFDEGVNMAHSSGGKWWHRTNAMHTAAPTPYLNLRRDTSNESSHADRR